jgi:DNA-binding NtrC family response regulator
MDADPEMRERVGETLRRAGYEVTGYGSLEETARQMARRRHDVVVAALDWAAGETASRVRAIHRHSAGLPLLLLCSPERVEQAVRALRHGAADYLLRPPDPVELKTRLGRILDHSELDSRIAFYQAELTRKPGVESLETSSPAMRTVVERLTRVAPMRSTVLISGESGVGKELVARSIHFGSPRRDRPFIALNYAAMPANLIESELFGHERGSFTGAHTRGRGKFEIAHRGTLFLDEIGEMSPGTQAKLLRVLEEREFMRVGGNRSIRVDVRVIAATNANLERLVAQSVFRQDLYYRLKVVTIHVPPLRERGEDLLALVDRFLVELSRSNGVPRKTLAPDVLAALRAYRWPGNVRELKNLLESLLVAVPGRRIRLDDLPLALRDAGPPEQPAGLAPGMSLASMERELIRRTLEHTGGNRTHSAALLGIGVRTLQRKIRTYGIHIALAPRVHDAIRRRSVHRDARTRFVFS